MIDCSRTGVGCYSPVTEPVVTPPLSIDRGVTGGGVGNE